MENETIFELTRNDWKYKGILFAYLDYKNFEFDDDISDLHKHEVVVTIWADENDDWIAKGRVKFSSGNKAVFEKNYGKNRNETKILTELYQEIPLKNKKWCRNKTQDIQGMMEILEKNNVIESIIVCEKEPSNKKYDDNQ